jgi:hypothetical protein
MKPTNQIGRDTKWPVSTEDTMQAIVQNGYDSADVLRLEQVTRPAIADNEVLLRVHAAGLDRGTWHLMTGHPYLLRLASGFAGPRTRCPAEMSPGRLSLSSRARARRAGWSQCLSPTTSLGADSWRYGVPA